ncbi:hypothetical protein [Methylobacterium nigriterrae]|uniref:hypothetical protein n=1 Tax=Methylobacterium nigriterrae TaxID=3127512 RepID=UPI0030139802
MAEEEATAAFSPSEFASGPDQIIDLFGRAALTEVEVEASDGTVVRFTLPMNARATVITGSPAPKIRIKEASVDHGRTVTRGPACA